MAKSKGLKKTAGVEEVKPEEVKEVVTKTPEVKEVINETPIVEEAVVEEVKPETVEVEVKPEAVMAEPKVDIGDKVNELVSNTSQKIAQATKDFKTQQKIKELRKETEQLFTQLGKRYYQLSDKKIPAALQETIDQITAKIVEENQLNTTEAEQTDSIVCPRCQAINNKGAHFCRKCGKKLDA